MDPTLKAQDAVKDRACQHPAMLTMFTSPPRSRKTVILPGVVPKGVNEPVRLAG